MYINSASAFFNFKPTSHFTVLLNVYAIFWQKGVIVVTIFNYVHYVHHSKYVLNIYYFKSKNLKNLNTPVNTSKFIQLFYKEKNQELMIYLIYIGCV